MNEDTRPQPDSGKELVNGATVEGSEISSDSVVHLPIEEGSVNSDCKQVETDVDLFETLPSTIELIFKDFHTQETFSVEFAITDDMDIVAKKIFEIRSFDALFVLIYDGKLLRGSFDTVGCLGFTPDKFILYLSDQEVIHNQRNCNETRTHEEQRVESMRPYQEIFHLGKIKDEMNEILSRFNGNVIDSPENLEEQLRGVQSHSVKLIESRYDGTKECIRIIDNVVSNRNLELDNVRFQSRIDFLLKMFSKLEDNAQTFVGSIPFNSDSICSDTYTKICTPRWFTIAFVLMAISGFIVSAFGTLFVLTRTIYALAVDRFTLERLESVNAWTELVMHNVTTSTVFDAISFDVKYFADFIAVAALLPHSIMAVILFITRIRLQPIPSSEQAMDHGDQIYSEIILIPSLLSSSLQSVPLPVFITIAALIGTVLNEIGMIIVTFAGVVSVLCIICIIMNHKMTLRIKFKRAITSMRSDCVMLNHLIDDAMCLLLEDDFSQDVGERFKELLATVKAKTTELHNDIAKAKSLQSVSIRNLKRCVDDLLQSVNQMPSVIDHSTSDFLDKEIMKQVVVQGLFMETQPGVPASLRDSDNLPNLDNEEDIPDEREMAFFNLVLNYCLQRKQDLALSATVQIFHKYDGKLRRSLRIGNLRQIYKDLKKSTDVKIKNVLGIHIKALGILQKWKRTKSENVSFHLRQISKICMIKGIPMRSIEIRKKIFGKDHYLVAEDLEAFASGFHHRSEHSKAKRYYERGRREKSILKSVKRLRPFSRI